MRVLLATVLVLLAAVPAARADTIVFRRGTDVWRMAPDGSGQTPLTGGARRYEWPSAADDGTSRQHTNAAIRPDLIARTDSVPRLPWPPNRASIHKVAVSLQKVGYARAMEATRIEVARDGRSARAERTRDAVVEALLELLD